MSSQSYDTLALPPIATLLDDWTTEIVPQLPADLDVQARKLGALVRKRAFGSAAVLLRGLLAYVLVCTSLRQLGAWGVLSGVAAISAQAWLQRLRAAGPFLLWLLGELLQSALAPICLGQRARPVRLVDAMMLRAPVLSRTSDS